MRTSRAAGAAVEGDAVPNLELRDAGSDLYDGAGGLATDGHRDRRWVCIPALVHLGEVQANRLDFDDGLTRPGFGIRDVLVDQPFRPAGLVDSDGFHGNPPSQNAVRNTRNAFGIGSVPGAD